MRINTQPPEVRDYLAHAHRLYLWLSDPAIAKRFGCRVEKIRQWRANHGWSVETAWHPSSDFKAWQVSYMCRALKVRKALRKPRLAARMGLSVLQVKYWSRWEPPRERRPGGIESLIEGRANGL